MLKDRQEAIGDVVCQLLKGVPRPPRATFWEARNGRPLRPVPGERPIITFDKKDNGWLGISLDGSPAAIVHVRPLAEPECFALTVPRTDLWLEFDPDKGVTTSEATETWPGLFVTALGNSLKT